MLHQPCENRDSYYLSIDVVAESQRGCPDHKAKYVTESGLDLVLLYSKLPRLNVLTTKAFRASQRSKHPLLQWLSNSLCVVCCPSTMSQHKLFKKYHVMISSHLAREFQTTSDTSQVTALFLLWLRLWLELGWKLGQALQNLPDKLVQLKSFSLERKDWGLASERPDLHCKYQRMAYSWQTCCLAPLAPTAETANHSILCSVLSPLIAL